MGWGDEIMGSGLAREIAARGKRAAFGHSGRIIWSEQAHQIYHLNPDVAPPGDHRADDLEWVHYCKGNRIYGSHANGVWTWHYDRWKAKPGRMVFDDQELEAAQRFPAGAILIEPNTKDVYPNKRWGADRWQKLATKLRKAGHNVVQYDYGKPLLDGVIPLQTESFRLGLAMMTRASIYIGPEGGLHHGAAAVGKRAVVIFGGYVTPLLTGYDTHINFTGTPKACGRLALCQHCINAMNEIRVEDVFDAATGIL